MAKRNHKMVLYILIGVPALYIGLILLGYVFQERLIFQTTRELYRDPSYYKWPFEDVLLPVDGYVTHGWFIPSINARGVVIFSHGNAGNIADRLESIGLLRSFGFSVLAYDYGGYGKSTGKPSEQRCCADIEAMWRYLTEARGIPAEKIMLFGRSLGGGATAHLAARVKPAAVVLESTFTSMPDAAQAAFPLFPARWIVHHYFPNAENVRKISAPLLIVHSRQDDVIPFRHGETLFKNANEPKTFLEIFGVHNEGFVLSEDIYRQGWEDFLAPILPMS
ncbi:MAG TPA: alpha/beta hydrolase [Candidatus Hydrogenedentes bacterium]|nr:alpha/beta hydrolase [Candidatus Hydrogenedentota bacterium]